MLSEDRKEHYLKLALAVYRVTELLPEGELLLQLFMTSAKKVIGDLILPGALLTTEG